MPYGLIVPWVAAGISLIALSITAIKWWQERRDKRIEEARRKKAESEIDDRNRRALGPRLRAERLWANVGSMERSHEFDLPSSWVSKPGETTKIPDAEEITVRLLLSNDGETVFDVRTENITETAFTIQIDPNGLRSGKGVVEVYYHLNRLRIGQPDRFKIVFETKDGRKMSHIYQAGHGVCELHRVDPK